ncbi:glycogen synthase kinase 3 [Yamadazyma tenuis]|uniref:Pkinase-domain-containing protein n=1 Tax=Candida tenuis (strain ATCC 10573 / BCRC 21748 / CBS 615 / JCM 9827 / NBRC 10315 / NRRL Y-1498 / VKM Y-70) TaxID=590646 RepID=G3B7U0_CANTC|nr:Pkinase-domain-containing protein [Yamadazyma tenuis ATCC 10573]EGV62320.1 Pkinase-domain-containing protein [Yamadazyma tenuis ATCC 10573]WEJ93579.1 glycogen synthase kinase 3 [Yamadazyma tenuis]
MLTLTSESSAVRQASTKSEYVTEQVHNCFNDTVSTIHYSDPMMVGHGSFGKVFKTQVSPTNEVIAIKTVLQDPKFKNRELQIMKLIHHPNIVDLKYFFYKSSERHEVYLNLMLEYVPETLYQYIKYYTLKKMPMPLLEIKLYFYQILRAINFINIQGVCHRDIKPQNLLVNPATCELKLCDFGSAKVLKPHEPNVSYACSRYYRAPELIFGNSFYSTKIDVWSIGCVVGEMILGRPLFIGESSIDQLVEIIKVLGTPTRDQIRSMNPTYSEHKFPKIKSISLAKLFKRIPPDLVSLMARVLTYDPSQRLTCIEAMLDPYFDELKVQGARVSTLRNNNAMFPPLFNFSAIELSASPQNNTRLVPEWAHNQLLISLPLQEFRPLNHIEFQIPPI